MPPKGEQAGEGIGPEIEQERVDVLIIDDDPSVNDLVSAYLSHKGLKIKTSLTGSQGLEMIKTYNPKLILLDINLPDANGFNLCGRIKSTLEDVVIMYITSEPKEIVVRRTENTEAEGYILKPFDLSDLDVVLNHV